VGPIAAPPARQPVERRPRVGQDEAGLRAVDAREEVRREHRRLGKPGHGFERHHGHPAWQPPPRGLRGRRDRLVRGRRIGEEQLKQATPAPIQLVRGGRAHLPVPLGRRVGDLVEVAEDGLRQGSQRVRRRALGRGEVDQPAPADAGTQAQRGVQRVEATTLVRLSRTDRAEHLAPTVVPAVGPGQPVHKVPQGLLDGELYRSRVHRVQRPCVLRDLRLHLFDHLGRDAVEVRPDPLDDPSMYRGTHCAPRIAATSAWPG
jgi:hypothetical protein